MKLLIADDHQLFLDGLSLLIQTLLPQAELHRAHSYSDIESKSDEYFDAVIIDLNMPGMRGTSSVRRFAKRYHGKVLVLSSSESLIEQQECIAAGAWGFISKGTERQQLIQELSRFIENSLDPERPSSASRNQPSTDAINLTNRQKQVLLAVADGLTNKQIAAQLHISENTVKKHLIYLFSVFKASTRSECIQKARSEKLV